MKTRAALFDLGSTQNRTRRRATALLSSWFLLASPAAAFDTYWHSQSSQKGGEQLGFTQDAWKIMQLGNFSPDFFGPVAEYASKKMQGQELEQLNQFVVNNAQIRGAALFLHFDNLNNELQSNSNFDYLFSHLLQSTQNLLAEYNKLQVEERVRKVLTLITLGASLHVVQDFYSHSDWIHNDFDKTDVKMVALPAGGWRAPTWFEYRSKHGEPDKWPFTVKSGVYPPIADAPNTHTHMNHDNSRLMYIEYENPGQPLRSQAAYHNAGPVPAHGDEASDRAHQQLAVATALAASIEWLNKVEENGEARKAIESAKRWNLKGRDAHLGRELEAATLTATILSCVAGKWDGDEPSGDQGTLCRAVLERRMNSLGGTSRSQLPSEIIGLAVNLAMPAALKFTGMFWDVHGQYHILERLVEGIGSNSGHYSLGKK